MKHFFLKKFLWLIGCIISIGSLSVGASAQYSGSGSGTSTDPYRIFNAVQLNQVRNFLNNPDVHFALESDIDLTNWIAANAATHGWQSIGNETSPFKGTFDGKNHKITGLKTMYGNSAHAFKYVVVEGL